MASFNRDGSLDSLDGDEIQEMTQLVPLSDWAGREIERIQEVKGYSHIGSHGCHNLPFFIIFKDGSRSEISDTVAMMSFSRCKLESLLELGLLEKDKVKEMERQHKKESRKAEKIAKLKQDREDLIKDFADGASWRASIGMVKQIRGIERQLSELGVNFDKKF